MILLDTHVWVWWVHGDRRLSERGLGALDRLARDTIGISVMSCWEVAMLYQRGRLSFSCSLDSWLEQALAYPGVELLGLTRAAAVEACRLPGTFHNDPADRMFVETAMENGCPLVTDDKRILEYPHINALLPSALAQE